MFGSSLVFAGFVRIGPVFLAGTELKSVWIVICGSCLPFKVFLDVIHEVTF